MYLSFSSPFGCSVEGSPEQIICLSLTLSLPSYHVILSLSSIFTCMYMHACFTCGLPILLLPNSSTVPIYKDPTPLISLLLCPNTPSPSPPLPRSLINSGTATHAGQQHWWQLPFLGGLHWALASRGGVKTKLL